MKLQKIGSARKACRAHSRCITLQHHICFRKQVNVPSIFIFLCCGFGALVAFIQRTSFSSFPPLRWLPSQITNSIFTAHYIPSASFFSFRVIRLLFFFRAE
uniref:Uncharacterized protein n=1 Tax=Parascaris univalens TaxID=6257 RepID=A0A915C173_PARUN